MPCPPPPPLVRQQSIVFSSFFQFLKQCYSDDKLIDIAIAAIGVTGEEGCGPSPIEMLLMAKM